MTQIQDHYQQLINYFERTASLDETEKQAVRDLFVPNTYKRKEFALREGEICRQFTFVAKGCLRMYKVDDKGNTHILHFGSEDRIVLDAVSFREQSPSYLYIDALEPTEVLQISPENLRKLYLENPKFNFIVREMLEVYLSAVQKRLMQYMSSTGEERYLEFLKLYPQLANRLPQTQIAAYLGVTPEYLSKIRNDITKSRHFIS